MIEQKIKDRKLIEEIVIGFERNGKVSKYKIGPNLSKIFGRKMESLKFRGESDEIDDIICSRFLRNGKNLWMIQEIQNGGIEFINDKSENSPMFVNSNRRMFQEDFQEIWTKILSQKYTISFNMRNLLGIGGESVVISKIGYKQNLTRAPKIKMIKNAMEKPKFSEIQNLEYSSNNFKHENFISYHDTIIDVVPNGFSFVFGKFLFVVEKSFNFIFGQDFNLVKISIFGKFFYFRQKFRFLIKNSICIRFCCC